MAQLGSGNRKKTDWAGQEPTAITSQTATAID
jgi:hypothetical protein